MKRNASFIKKAIITVAHPDRRHRIRAAFYVSGAVLWLLAGSFPAGADQIEMQNGDHFAGQVLSLSTNVLVLQSDLLGTLSLPRAKVAVITLGADPATSSPALPSLTGGPARPPSIASANGATNLSPALRKLGTSTNLIEQVQKQLLGGAGDEANNKFNEMLGGLMTGKLSVDDIRAQAQSAADQLRKLRREGGEEAGFATDAYLAILDHFLKETTPTVPATNAPTRASLSKAKPAPEEE
jgi:hypothetical protein